MEKFKTPFNSIPEAGELNSGITLTIPGQVQSIAEMLRRIENGQPIQRNGLDYNNEDIPLPIIKDLTDIDDVKQTINQTFAKQKQAEFLKKEAEKSKKDDVIE
nr:MAG: hypothetical protein [Microvirus sp.]